MTVMSEAAQLAKRREADELARKGRATFAQRHGVRRFKLSETNLVRFVRSGTGDPEAIKKLADLARHYHWDYGLFDHPEIWGKCGCPTHIIGHSYQVLCSSIGTMERLKAAGFGLVIHGDSWYGFGTIQVCAYHPTTLI